jgi:hypothetical protein
MEIEDKYLSGKNCKEGDIVEFLNEGEKAEIEQRDKSRKKVYNFAVKLNGTTDYIYTPSSKALRAFIEVWGRNTTAWIGKKFQIKLVLMEIAGKEMNVIRPQFLESKA